MSASDIAGALVATPRPKWWRLKAGLVGLKRIMPDRTIQYAQRHGYGWTVHYEPVCSACPAITGQCGASA